MALCSLYALQSPQTQAICLVNLNVHHLPTPHSLNYQSFIAILKISNTFIWENSHLNNFSHPNHKYPGISASQTAGIIGICHHTQHKRLLLNPNSIHNIKRLIKPFPPSSSEMKTRTQCQLTMAKYLKKLKGEKICWPHCYGPVVKQKINGGEGVVEQSCSHHVGWEAKRKDKKDIAFRGMLLKTYHLQFHYLPIIHSPMNLSMNYSINDVKALMIQSLPQSPISEYCCIGDLAFNK